MHDVLIVADKAENWHAGACYAADIARTLDGSLTGTYMMPPVGASFDFAPPALVQEIIEICRQQSDAAIRAGVSFQSWAAARGVRRSAWHVADGDPVEALLAAALWHDLLVLERSERLPLARIARVLLGVDVPCIVLPPWYAQGRCETVAVAWDGSLRATRALHAATPLLQRASTVLLLDGAGFCAHAEPGSAAVDAYLREHSIAASRLRLDAQPVEAGEALLAAATNAAADLLVMGAYGRLRVSEWLLGGATRHVLQHARLPVLMRH